VGGRERRRTEGQGEALVAILRELRRLLGHNHTLGFLILRSNV